MQWYIKCMQNYVTFSGRARRSEYWFFLLFYFIFVIVLGIIESVLGLANPDTGGGPISGIFVLAHLLPGIAVAVRRLHDSGRTGWWILINLIPLIGGIIFLFFMVVGSDDGDNEYGPSPLDEID